MVIFGDFLTQNAIGVHSRLDRWSDERQNFSAFHYFRSFRFNTKEEEMSRSQFNRRSETLLNTLHIEINLFIETKSNIEQHI